MTLLDSGSSMRRSVKLRVGWEWTQAIRSPEVIAPGRTPAVRFEGAGKRHAVPESTTVSLCGRNMQRVDEFLGWRSAGECCETCVQLERTAW